MASLPIYETKKPTGGKHLLGIYKNRRLLIELRRAQKALRFKRKKMQNAIVAAAGSIDSFTAHVDAEMELQQFARLKSASIMTLCYHTRFLILNREQLLKKLKGSQKTKIELFCKALIYELDIE